MAKVERVPLAEVVEIDSGAVGQVKSGMAKVKRVPLGTVAQIERVGASASAMEGESYISLEDIDSETGVIQVANRNTSQSTKFRFEPDHILYGKLRPYLHKVARPTAAGFCSTDILPIRPGKRLDGDFLYHFLRSPEFTAKATLAAVGVNLPRVGVDFLSTFTIPLPTLSEQRRIAAILDKADALRAKRRAALAQLDTLTQSIFLDMFGDPATNPKGWARRTLASVIANKASNGLFRKNDEYSVDGRGLPVVWVEALFRGDCVETTHSRRFSATPSEVQRYGLKSGDLLFCRSSVKFDGIAFNNVYLGGDDEALFECHLIRVTPRQSLADPMFLNFLFRLPAMRAIAKSKSKTATMTTIDQESLTSIELPVPPISLQQRFSRIAQSLGGSRASCGASLAELDALFASLQHRAFRGEL